MPINGFPGQVISATAPTVSAGGAPGIWGLDEQLQYAGQNLWPGYQISRSVRTRTSASAYFSRTPSAAGSRTTWTYSTWIKRGGLNSGYALFGCGANNTNDTICYFGPAATGDQMDIIVRDTSTIRGRLTTTPVYRDPGSWYHVVVVWDSGNATSGDRLRLYFNGVRVTAFSTETQPSQYTQSLWNSTQAAYIARMRTDTAYYFDGYMTEINFIDGQALDPSSFGINNALTGVWSPIKYAGTYGSNGFYLNFSDNSAATAAAIGKDYSGNGNNWTPNNISVTAGATYDSMVDVPVQYGSDTGVGGELRGNYAVINPLFKNSSLSVTNGNLSIPVQTISGTNYGAGGTVGVSSGKWYFEMQINASSAGTNDSSVGICKPTDAITNTAAGTGNMIGFMLSLANGVSVNYGTTTAVTGLTSLATNLIQVALDVDAGKVWFGADGVWANSGNPSTGANATYSSGIAGNTWVPALYYWGVGTSSRSINANFGQQAFSYTAPTSFKALCTANLTAPAIPNGASYMNATLYNGNSSTQTVNNSAGFYPDFNWIKIRSSTGSHVLVNSVAGGSKQLFSNLTNAEQTDTNMTSAISSSGIALGNNTTGTGNSNITGSTYVLWQWLAGAGSSSSNTNGSVTSTVSLNATSGFSVVTFTAPASGNFTAGHGLGVIPGMVITKVRGRATSWITWHNQLNSGSPGTSYYVELNTTTGQSTFASVWGSTGVTSSVIGMGVGASCAANDTLVAYCFAPIAGYSSFGSYTGNGAADGPFVYTGFRPRFILTKRYDGGANVWSIVDTSRNTYNAANASLYPNATDAESTVNYTVDINSNGFKFRSTSSDVNINGGTYIYAAFAENPFKFSLAR